MKAALLGDSVSGTHTVVVGEETITYTIGGQVSSASPNVKINGRQAARVGDTVSESCGCGGGTGVLISGSSKVFINGMPAAYAMAQINTHGDQCSLSGGGSTTVNIS